MDKILKTRGYQTFGLKFSAAIIVVAIVALLFTPCSPLKAEEPLETNILEEVPEEVIVEEVEQDENIKAEDFNIPQPKVLPNNPFYPIKNLWRGIKSALTFDPVKKVELKLRFANERIIEAKEMAEIVDKPKIVEKAIDKYQKEIGKIEKIVEKMPENVRIKPEMTDFIDNFTDHQFKQQKLIDRIEKQLPLESFTKINEIKEEGLKNFAGAVLTIVRPEVMQEKLERVIEIQPGSQFKNFKNLEILKALEEKVPEQAKEAIRQAQENAMKRLQEDINKMTEEKRGEFKNYVENIGGHEVRQLEILHEFAQEKVPEIIREEMEKAKEKTIKRIDDRFKEFRSEYQKDEFLKHLEGEKMKDLRIIKELENNLAPETIDKILEIKNKTIDQIRKNFEAAGTPEEQEKFFKEIDEFHDVKQFEVFKEIEKVIPEEKKEFFEKMKEKAIEEMKKDFEMARQQGKTEEVFGALAGDMPEHIKIIKEFGPPPEIMQGLLKEQVAQLAKKVERTEDVEKLKILSRHIAEEKSIQEELKKRAPEIFEQIETREENLLADVNKEKALAHIEKTKNELNLAEKELADFQTKGELVEYLKKSPALVLIANAKKHLEIAETVLRKELYGRVFGEATAAMHQAINVRKIIKEIQLREEIGRERMGKMLEIIPENLKGEMKEKIEEITPEKREEKIKEILHRGGEKIQEQIKNIPPEMLPGIIEKIKTEIKVEPGMKPPKIEPVEPEKPIVCPQFVPPSPDFCREGKIIHEKDSQGCPLPPKCFRPSGPEEGLLPIESEAKLKEQACICPLLYDPVCGRDGKTYNNNCLAQCAKTEIAFKGRCEEKEIE